MINDKPAYALQTESIYSRNYIGLHSVKDDYLQCKDALLELQKIAENKTNFSVEIGTIVWALTTSIIITYCKSFKDSSRHANAGIEWVPDEHRDIHKLFLDLRDSHVAHSGGTWESSTRLSAFNPCHSEKRHLLSHPPISSRTCNINPKLLPKAIELIDSLIRKAEKKRDFNYQKHQQLLYN